MVSQARKEAIQVLNEMMPSLLQSGFEDNPRALATVLWSSGRLSYVNADFLDLAQDGIRGNMDKFNIKDLV